MSFFSKNIDVLLEKTQTKSAFSSGIYGFKIFVRGQENGESSSNLLTNRIFDKNNTLITCDF